MRLIVISGRSIWRTLSTYCLFVKVLFYFVSSLLDFHFLVIKTHTKQKSSISSKLFVHNILLFFVFLINQKHSKEGKEDFNLHHIRQWYRHMLFFFSESDLSSRYLACSTRNFKRQLPCRENHCQSKSLRVVLTRVICSTTYRTAVTRTYIHLWPPEKKNILLLKCRKKK